MIMMMMMMIMIIVMIIMSDAALFCILRVSERLRSNISHESQSDKERCKVSACDWPDRNCYQKVT